MRNIFEMLAEGIGRNIDILLFSETKIDESFAIAQLKLNRNGGGLLFVC